MALVAKVIATIRMALILISELLPAKLAATTRPDWFKYTANRSRRNNANIR